MLPDYLIHEELKRKERQWEPVPLELPVHIPLPHPETNDVDDDGEPSTGVIIIDMEDYTEYEM